MCISDFDFLRSMKSHENTNHSPYHTLRLFLLTDCDIFTSEISNVLNKLTTVTPYQLSSFPLYMDVNECNSSWKFKSTDFLKSNLSRSVNRTVFNSKAMSLVHSTAPLTRSRQYDNLSFMAVYIPSFQVLRGRPRFFFPSGLQLIMIFVVALGPFSRHDHTKWVVFALNHPISYLACSFPYENTCSIIPSLLARFPVFSK
jgi:hypothetical protein